MQKFFDFNRLIEQKIIIRDVYYKWKIRHIKLCFNQKFKLEDFFLEKLLKISCFFIFVFFIINLFLYFFRKKNQIISSSKSYHFCGIYSTSYIYSWNAAQISFIYNLHIFYINLAYIWYVFYMHFVYILQWLALTKYINQNS